MPRDDRRFRDSASSGQGATGPQIDEVRNGQFVVVGCPPGFRECAAPCSCTCFTQSRAGKYKFGITIGTL